MQSTHLTLRTYTDPDFEAYISKLEKDQLTIAEENARTDGLSNKPTRYHQYKVANITPVKSVIQKAIDYNYSLHSPISNIAVGKKFHDAAAQKISVIEKDKNAKHKAITLGKNDLNSLKPSRRFLPKKLKYTIAGILGLIEGTVVFNILWQINTPFLLCVLIALATAVVTASGLYLAANWIRRAITVLQRRIRTAIVLSLAFGVSSAIGIWRSTMFNDISTANSQFDGNVTNASSSIPAWPFILISFVTFLVSLAFELKYWQTEKEKAAIDRYEEKKREIEALQREHEEIENKLEEIRSDSTVQSGTIMQRQEYAASNERRLVALAYHILSHYESANIAFRTDDQCPPFFGQKAPFDFTLYFTSLFKHLNQPQ